MTFAKRILNFTFQLGQGQFSADGSDTVTLEGLRASVTITRAGIGYARADVQIWGMSQDLMNKLTVTQKFFWQQVNYNQITISAGDDQGGVAVAFAGVIREAWADARQQPDVMFHVMADTAMFNLSKLIPPTSYNGAVDIATALSGIANQIGYTLKNSGVTGQLQYVYKPGSPKSQIESLCRDVGCDFDIDDAQMIIAIWPKNKARDAEAIKVSPDSGLVGYPAFTQSGLQLTTLYNPNLAYGVPIMIDCPFTAANGQWAVYSLSHRLEANIPQGQWFSDIETSYFGAG